MTLSKITKVAGLGAVALLLTAGVASAATATASVNVRTGPGTQFRSIDTLYAGERVGIVDQDGGWCAIQASGPDGWVSCRYLTSDNSFDARPSVTIRPEVSLAFGFGNAPQHRDRGHWSNGHWYDDDNGHWSGPRSSHYSSNGNYFGLSIAN